MNIHASLESIVAETCSDEPIIEIRANRRRAANPIRPILIRKHAKIEKGEKCPID